MLNFETIAVDPSLAREGVWMEYMGGRFLLARKGPEYKAAIVRMYNEHMDLIKSNTPEGDLKATEIYQIAFAEHVLLDWDKIVDNKKNPVPFSKELALKLIKDPRQIELIEKMEEFSMIHSNYQAAAEAEVAEDVKNTADS